ncbi:MAG: TolC family protein [Bacteroidota bacterium]
MSKHIYKTVILLSGWVMILLCSSAALKAQTATLSPEELIDWIRKYHPIALQADIRVEQSQSSVRMARAGFDPVLENETAQKTWNDRMYYYYNRPELSLPTWFGATFYAGQEFVAGNEVLSTDTKGETNYLGVSVPLAKNLLMDKRRATLRTAQVLQKASLVEKRIALNDLIKEGLYTYWDWVRSFEQRQQIKKTYLASEQRLNLIREGFRKGDRPAMDTLEAWAQMQQLAGMLTEAELQWQTQLRELSNFLWQADAVAYELSPKIEPDVRSRGMQSDSFPPSPSDKWSELLKTQNPLLQRYPLKLQELDIEKRLKFQDLLPDIRFQYNQLGRGYDFSKTFSQPMFENNYRYGLKMQLPLRLSMGRGSYQLAKQKIHETQLDRTWKQWSLENKLQNRLTEYNNLREQIDLQETATTGFSKLLELETMRFKQGESSLFLVNTREIRWLESAGKLLQLKIKRKQTRAAIDHLLGNFN